MSKINKNILILLLASFLIGACNLPTTAQVSSQPPASVQEAGAASAPTPTPIPTAVPVQACSPFVTANTMANVRSGPDIAYSVVGNLPQGGTAPVVGKSFDGLWWNIQFAGDQAWIAGSVTSATCIPTTLAIVAAPPPPPPLDVPASVPTKKPKKGEPDPTAVPTSSGPLYLSPIYIDPGFILVLPSPTPTICISCLIPIKPLLPIGPIGP